MKQRKQFEEIKTVAVKVPASLKDRLDDLVAYNRTSQSAEIIRILREALPQEKATVQ